MALKPGGQIWALGLFFLITAPFASTAQETEPAPVAEAAQPPQVSMVTDIAADHEPSPAYPFGRANPSGPPQQTQFDFMLGENDCQDQMLMRDGSWKHYKAIWNATYFLNGFGVQDRYWNGEFATSNIRLFDSQKGVWRVTFFRMPGYTTGTWEGGMVGDQMVLTRETTDSSGTVAVSRLVFFNMGREGFQWQAEIQTQNGTLVTWKSDCRKRR